MTAQSSTHSDFELGRRIFQQLGDLSMEAVRGFIDMFAVPAYVVDYSPIDGARYVALNPACADLLKVANAQFAGRTPAQVFGDHVASRAIADLEEVFAARRELAFERSTRIPGKLTWWQLTIQPIFSTDGQSARMIGTIVDITDRKQVEATLIERSSELNRALRIGKMGHWRFDVETKEMFWSPELYRIHGYPVSFKPTVAAIADALEPATRERFLTLSRKSLKEGVPFELEADIAKPDGSPLSIRFEAEPDIDRQGRVVGLFGITRDITQRRMAEKAREKSERLLRRSQRVGRLGHWRTSLVSTENEWSEEVYRLYGLNPESFTPARDNGLIGYSKPERARLGALLQDVVAQRLSGFKVEAEALRLDDGRRVTIAHEVEVEYDAQGQAVAIFGISQDITERAQAQRALRENEANLVRAQRMGRLGHWKRDHVTGKTFFSPEYLQLYGLPLDYDPGEAPLAGLGHSKEEIKRFLGVYQAALDQHLSYFNFEGSATRPDGALIAVRVEVELERDAHGEVIASFGITQDVTSQVRQEQALREREATLKRAMAVGKIGSWRHDWQTGRIFWSPELYEMLGADISEQPLTAGASLKRYPAADRQRVIEIYERAVKTGEPFSFDTAVLRKDGAPLWVHIEGEVDRDPKTGEISLFGVVKNITERMLAEQALRESEANLRRASRVGRIGHWRHDLGRADPVWSQELYDILGVTPDSWRPTLKTQAQLFRPEDWQGYRDLVRRSAKTGDPINLEAPIRRPTDGGVIWIRIEAEVDRDPDTGHVSLFGVAQDITESKRAELELRNTAALLTRAQRVGRIGHWRSLLDENALTWSEEVYRIHGLSPETFQPTLQNVLQFYEPGFAEKVVAVREEATLRRTNYGFEADIKRADGAPLSIHVEGEAEYDQNGRVIGYFGITQDITERRAMERALQEAEERNRRIVTMLESAEVGVAIMNRNGYIEVANAPMAHFAGLESVEQLSGMRFRDLRHPDDAEMAQIIVDFPKAIRRDGYYQGEMDWRGLAGGARRVFVRASALSDGDVLFLVIDNTEIIRMRERSAQLERSFQQVQKMEAIGQLASSLAHEVNNLLQPILTFAREAQRDVPEQQRREYLDLVIGSARQMRDMAVRMLGFSRPATERPEPRSAEGLIANVCSLARSLLPKGCTLNGQVQTLAQTYLLVTESEFTQVLVNLLINAADAMDGGGEVRLEAGEVDVPDSLLTTPQVRPGRYVRVEVSDTGHGMSEETMSRIFEPFFSTKAPGKGTGLGLTVVFSILSRWQGGMTIASTPSQGASFTLYIPVAPAPVQAQAAE
jgi:PAS domain S-box-containing protein